MIRILALVRRELRAHFVSPVAWSVAAGYLFLAGYFFFNLVSDFSATLREYGLYAQIYRNPALLEQVNLNQLVVANLYMNLLVLLIFVVPLLTMRGFAEERRQGTDELLLTAPVTPGQLVVGKYVALLVVAGILVGASGGLLFILMLYGDPESGPVWTGLAGLALAAAALAALGLAVSAATDSLVVAGIGSLVLFLLLFVLDWPARTVGGLPGKTLEAMALPAHFRPFTRGLVASPDVVYYLSLIALGLFAARAIVASQRWR